MGESSESKWAEVSTPVSSTLYAVERTRSGAVAVGSGGNILVRRDGGWTTADADGPGDAGNSLYAAASTDDGKRVWFGGSSGALGYYDVAADEVVDYSAPEGITGSWKAIAVAGTAGREKVLVANGSAEVLSGTISGGKPETVDWVYAASSDDGDGLGGGSSVHSIEAGPDAPYATNSSGGLFHVVDGQWVHTGIEAAESTIYDVHVDEQVTLAVGANGYVYRRVDSSWEASDVASGPLYGVGRDPKGLVAVGASGRLFRRVAPGQWTRVQTPMDEPLRDLELATDPELVVGGSGTILERPTPEKKSGGSNRDADSTPNSSSGPSKSSTPQQSNTNEESRYNE
ncbi:hypothetical protein [Halospeciosus flavus]|uniref:Uncharacterized protein n=1 Tax=Halospeciosus flavus TaxID=3032283 RepID=A0ABD5Z4V5_9EURY|nr:hypothetical protein [Halospeciosus flavus]